MDSHGSSFLFLWKWCIIQTCFWHFTNLKYSKILQRTWSNIIFQLFYADHHTHDHTHDPGVSSVSIVCEGILDLEKVSVTKMNSIILHCTAIITPSHNKNATWISSLTIVSSWPYVRVRLVWKIFTFLLVLFRQTCGLVRYCWTVVKTYTGWRVFYQFRAWMSDSSFRWVFFFFQG